MTTNLENDNRESGSEPFNLEELQISLKARKKKVLIIGQNRFENSHLLSEVKRLGYTGQISTTGRDGLLSLFFEQPKILFLDPVFNGEFNQSLLDRIKKSYPELSIVLLLDPDKENLQTKSEKSEQTIIKPVDLAQLKELMKELIKK